MGTYDEFFDYERNRYTQTKAFFNIMEIYEHDIDMNDVIPETDTKYRTYYVMAGTPCYFIRIEGNNFTGIVSITEDNILRYPTLDYYGKEILIDGDYAQTLTDLANLSEIIENNAEHLAMNKLRDEYLSVQYHTLNRISGKKAIW